MLFCVNHNLLYSSRLYGRYCGRLPAWTLYGSNRTIVVIAHTDDDVTKYGFRAVYQVSSLKQIIFSKHNQSKVLKVSSIQFYQSKYKIVQHNRL